MLLASPLSQSKYVTLAVILTLWSGLVDALSVGRNLFESAWRFFGKKLKIGWMVIPYYLFFTH